jgi:putative ABC transport system permease protein
MWRGFVSRKVRVGLTAVAVALGVALMAGTYILTDTINASFASIFASTTAGISAVVSPHEALGDNNMAQISPITSPMLAKVRRVPGVAWAAGTIWDNATLLGPGGKSLDTSGPGFVSSVLPAPFSPAVQVAGRLPEHPGEADIDEVSAQRAHLRLGQDLRVAGTGPAHRYVIVGTFSLAGVSTFGGASVVVLTVPQAQAVVGEVGRYDQIDVSATPGVTPAQLRGRLEASLPASVVVRTGSAQAAQEESDVISNLSFLRTFLLVFAYVALFVGAFIILNTFSITVAQRTRELGLMRAMGASRRQVLGSMVGESLLLGLVGSVVGLGLGLLVAPGLDRLFVSFGANIPDSGTVLETRTVIVSLLAGVLTSLGAGLAPALRATRVPPVAALREGVKPEAGRLARHSLIISLVVLAMGAVMVGGGLVGSGSAALVGAGGLVVFVGVALLSPKFVPALARGIGLLVTWRGVTGKLARENARRQPGRTAVTAASLMIGLALVSFVSIVASGTKATLDSAVNGSFAGNLIVESSSTTSNQGIPVSLAVALGKVRGVSVVAPVSFSEAQVQGVAGTQTVTGVDGALAKLYRVKWVKGSSVVLSGLRGDNTVLSRSFARSNHVQVGHSIAVVTPSGDHLRLLVRGIVSDDANLLGALTVSRSLVQSSFSQSSDGVDFIGYAKGASNATVQPAVDRLLTRSFPQAGSRTAAQFKQQEANQVDSLLALMYVLLALAVLVSLFGLVNTLVLSIYERTREIGMMRAVGTSRRQVRQVVRYESVVTSLIGAVTGLVVGGLFAIAMARSLGGAGVVLSVPVGTLATLLVLAALAGVAAAALPARRAARTDVLLALSAE